MVLTVLFNFYFSALKTDQTAKGILVVVITRMLMMDLMFHCLYWKCFFLFL